MPVTGYTAARSDAIQMLSLTGEETLPRENVSGSAALTTQGLYLSYFAARHTGTVTSVITQTTGTAAGATPTVARVGVYSVDPATGNITLIGSTTHNGSMWNTINTAYTQALSTPAAIVKGNTYATGVLIVSGAAMPTLAAGPTTLIAANQALAPRMTGLVTGQSNLPASVVAGSITNTERNFYARLVP